MIQSSISEYNEDEKRALDTLKAIQEFVNEFKTRQEIGELRRLLDGDRLDGGILEQAPEDFTEHELIEPCLDALGYFNPKSSEISNSEPQFGRQPTRFPKVESNLPDYELRNVHDQLTCIVEVKAINRDQSGGLANAKERIEKYLVDDTFCKHIRDEPRGVLVGIGTDGFRWTLWIKDLQTGVIFDDVSQETIVDPISDITAIEMQEVTKEKEARQTRIHALDKLKTQLVCSFSRENLLAEVSHRVDQVTVESQ